MQTHDSRTLFAFTGYCSHQEGNLLQCWTSGRPSFGDRFEEVVWLANSYPTSRVPTVLLICDAQTPLPPSGGQKTHVSYIVKSFVPAFISVEDHDHRYIHHACIQGPRVKNQNHKYLKRTYLYHIHMHQDQGSGIYTLYNVHVHASYILACVRFNDQGSYILHASWIHAPWL